MKRHNCALAKRCWRLALLAAMLGYSASSLAVGVKIRGDGLEGLRVDVFGFAQLGAQKIDRTGDAKDQDNFAFGADRIRFGFKMKWDKWTGFLLFNPEASGSNPATLSKFFFDAFVAYEFDDAFQLKLGQFKTPIGLSFSVIGHGLPMIKRTMASRLVLNRDLGVMLSGRKIAVGEGHLGYDLGIFNPADRSGAVMIDTAQKGQDYAYAARLMYDLGKTFHVEASVGRVENAGGIKDDGMDGTPVSVDTEDYDVFDVGAIYTQGPLRLRAEYADGNNVYGERDRDEEAWFLEAGYAFNDIVQGMVRYQEAETDIKGVQADLERYEVGVNLFLGQNKRNARVQLNYASVGGDEDGYEGAAGKDNNRYDAILAQVQFAF